MVLVGNFQFQRITFNMYKDITVSKGSMLYFNEYSGECIFATNRHITIDVQAGRTRLKLPFRLLDLFGFSRLCSRLFRLDRVNLLYIDDANLAFLRQGVVFHYCRKTGHLSEAYRLSSTRNILAESCASGPDGQLVFGDYGGKGRKDGVYIYRSYDYGRSWAPCFQFPQGAVKQVLAINWDLDSLNYWINTGDDVGECFLWRFNENLELLERVGDGSLSFRAISCWVFPDLISWVTNDPFNGSRLMSLDLYTRKLTRGERIDGSVWYSKRLADGCMVLTTCAEVLSWDSEDCVKVLAAQGEDGFKVIRKYSKDSFSKWLFRFGIASFPQGVYSSENLHINFEAVKTLDGKVVRVDLS